MDSSKDAPELREKIRRVRRQCVEGCKQTNAQILPQIKRFESINQSIN
jgi:16S rRNA U1498 N3-methylase RsmE